MSDIESVQDGSAKDADGGQLESAGHRHDDAIETGEQRGQCYRIR